MHAQQITFYHAVIITFLVFGTVSAFFIVAMFKQHRRNINLYKAKVAAEISTLENERQRIANDLHDDLGPLLSAIKFNIGELEVSKEDLLIVNVAESYLDEVVQKIRQISNDLMPATLIRKGLTYAVEEFVEKIQGSIVHIVFNHAEIPSLPDQININLYRIILEIIHNTLKHAEAKQLVINLSSTGNKIHLETKDDGAGFAVSTVSMNNSGRGLQNILNRTELLDGDMFIESAPGKGTNYLITIPY